MKEYLKLFPNGFDETLTERRAVENYPFVGYDEVTEELVFTIIPKPVTDPADNEIWYTSSDGNVVTPSAADGFGGEIVSNTYEDGKGVIKFKYTVPRVIDYAFYNCDSLTSIILPNRVKSIGMNAFEDCSSLISIVIPDGVTSIEWAAFKDCSSLTSIVIPESVKSIGDWAFGGCSSFTTIVIPDSVTSIGDYAFRNCTSLSSIVIGNSVTSIGIETFWNCPSLTSITFKGTVEQWNNINKYSDWNWEFPATYVQCTDGQVTL